MDALVKLSSVMGLSLTSGINLYATVAVVGLVTRYNLVQGLPPEFQAFNNDLVIVLAIILYLCEFAADKIPVFDSIWDSIHTIIRPFGAALISITVVGKANPSLEVIAALLGASLALGTHAAKAGTRLIVNTSPEPFSNIILSVGEDIGVVGMSLLVLSHPYVSLVISLILLFLLVKFGPGLWRGVLLAFRALFVKLGAAFLGARETVLKEFLPDVIDEVVDGEIPKGEKVQVCLQCFARKIPGCGRNRKGYLLLSDNQLLFAFRRFFRTRMRQWKFSELEKVKLQQRFLVDILGIKSERKFSQFVFLKNKSHAVKQLFEAIDKKVAPVGAETASTEATAAPDAAGS